MISWLTSYFKGVTSSPPASEMIKEVVETLIKSNSVMACFYIIINHLISQVFSKSYCPFCVKAKRLLDSLSVKYTAMELDQESNGDEIQAYLYQKTQQRTVPNIFISQDHLGGCDDLHKAHASGELKEMLSKL